MTEFSEQLIKFFDLINNAELYVKELDNIKITDDENVDKEYYNKNIINFFNELGHLLFYEENNINKCILETEIPLTFKINLPIIGDFTYDFPYKKHKIYNFLLYSHDYDNNNDDYKNTHYKKYTIDKILEGVSIAKMLINPEKIEARLLATRRLLQALCNINDTDIIKYQKQNITYPQQIKLVLVNAPKNTSSIYNKLTNNKKNTNIDSKYGSVLSKNNSLQIIDGKIQGEVRLGSKIPIKERFKKYSLINDIRQRIRREKQSGGKSSTIKVKVGHRN